MPILTFQLSGQAQRPDGKTIQIPPGDVLTQHGPRVQVAVTVAEPVAKTLAEEGKPVPAPVTGWALIDTGASVTCVDDVVAQNLGLPVVDVATMCSASHAQTQQNLYPVQLQIAGLNFRFNILRCMGAALQPQGIVALIGRDALRHCTIFYNGLNGEVTIAI